MSVPDYDAEGALMGCICTDEEVYARVVPLVSRDDIRAPANRLIYDAAAQLHREGRPVDPLLLLDIVGVQYTDYVRQLIEMTPAVHNAELYAAEMHKAAVAARIREACSAAAAAGTLEGVMDHLARAQAVQVDTVRHDAGGKVVAPAQAMAPYLTPETQDGAVRVVPTGYDRIDALLGGGMLIGGMYILGARTGVGKTSLALSIADNAIGRGEAVLYCSLEMGAAEIGAKRLARRTGIDSGRILRGELTPEERERVTEAAAAAADRPLYLMDNMGTTIDDIRAAAGSTPGLRLIVIDYIGLLAMAGKGSRYEAVTAVSRQIKVLAHELGVPILALSQLRRECEDSGFDSAPRLSDLRDSGALEQDADGVIMLWCSRRRSVDGARQEIKICVAKNRHGGVGTCAIGFQPEVSKFFRV